MNLLKELFNQPAEAIALPTMTVSVLGKTTGQLRVKSFIKRKIVRIMIPCVLSVKEAWKKHITINYFHPENYG
jgi:hypothetical protein